MEGTALSREAAGAVEGFGGFGGFGNGFSGFGRGFSGFGSGFVERPQRDCNLDRSAALDFQVYRQRDANARPSLKAPAAGGSNLKEGRGGGLGG